MRRTAAVDYGRRRIGLAVADPLGITVRGLETLQHEGDAGAAAPRVAAALRAEEVGRVLVGLPLHAGGEESEMSAEARRFGAALARASGLPVAYLDETLTSWEAEEALKARGIGLQDARKRGLLDREAAVAMLRGWLRDGQNWPSDAEPAPDPGATEA